MWIDKKSFEGVEKKKKKDEQKVIGYRGLFSVFRVTERDVNNDPVVVVIVKKERKNRGSRVRQVNAQVTKRQ